MEIVACYAIWNEAGQIAESLRSVKAYVDRYVVVDAVFADNPIAAAHSSDRTREIVEATCPPRPLTYLASDVKLPEYAARNRYLEELDDGDWALVIDGDEVLYGEHRDVLELCTRIRAGDFDAPEYQMARRPRHGAAIGIPVYTQRIIFWGQAPDVDAATYATAPIVDSVGTMARFFRVDCGLRYPEGPSNQGLFRAGRWVGRPTHEHSCAFLVNHRLRQTLAGYQLDHEWLSKVRGR